MLICDQISLVAACDRVTKWLIKFSNSYLLNTVLE